jgi:hypothetical protein
MDKACNSGVFADELNMSLSVHSFEYILHHDFLQSLYRIFLNLHHYLLTSLGWYIWHKIKKDNFHDSSAPSLSSRSCIGICSYILRYLVLQLALFILLSSNCYNSLCPNLPSHSERIRRCRISIRDKGKVSWFGRERVQNEEEIIWWEFSIRKWRR